MKVAELEGALLDYWVARAIGMVLVPVGYLDTESETPEQKQYDEWMDINGLDSVGLWWIEPNGRNYYAAIPINERQKKYESEQWELRFSPCSDWSQGGPLMERENIGIGPGLGTKKDRKAGLCYAYFEYSVGSARRISGRTFLEAAMRAFVLKKIGDEVPEK